VAARRIAILFGVALALALGAPGGAALAQGYGGGAPAGPSGGAPTPGAEKKDEKPRKSWSKKEKKGMGKSQVVRERTGKRLLAAQELFQANQFAQAEAELGKLRLRGLNTFERARTHQMYAAIAAAQLKPQKAREHFQQALAEDALPPAEQASVRYQIAQLYLGESKWPEAIENLKQWFAVAEEKPAGGYYLLALAYYQMGEIDQAADPAQQAVDLTQTPQEAWLQLLLAIRLTKASNAEDEAQRAQLYKAAEPVMTELLRRYPKKLYWTQMSTLYGAQEDYDKALVYLELAKLQGMLDQDEDLRRVAQLMLARDLPYPAAQLLEEGFAKGQLREDSGSFELLSTAWIQARDFDRALGPLQKAAELSSDGKLSIRLAQLYLQREEWKEAEAALRRGIDKGGLSSPADAQILMGIVIFSAGRLDESLGWFARAREHPETRDEAVSWIQHIEQQRLAAQAAGG